MEDTYKTISEVVPETLYKEKNSKFLGYAYPISAADELKPIIESLKKQHPNAVHYCFAFRIGTGEIYERANDDGEPANTAGAPILGQIKSFDLTNVLVVVVRYYGGIKLGVGGLIAAYRKSAQITLEEASIETRLVLSYFDLSFTYELLNKVMRIIREKQLTIESQQMEMDCLLTLSVRKSEAEKIPDYFSGVNGVKVSAKTT
ncbi:IMPACT family protein [Flavobacterium silvaticum]|uniref:YigZ family protein n=1 Tax=Flavobacterium silvaticum TaxID=1852020 RepID=A0A972FLQ2_9FLAO|nr:YigZ family protein [Flavobacterium silvaticum]NMH28038.1 YigZ family protein [Flavobacterium silvaticum]